MLLTSSCKVTCIQELLILYKYRKEAQKNLEAVFPRSKISSHTSKCLTNYSVHIFCLIPNVLSLILTSQLLVVQGHDINTKRQVIKREILIVPFIKLKQLPVNLINWNGTFSLVLCVGIFFTHLTNELYHRIALRRVFVQITEGAL